MPVEEPKFPRIYVSLWSPTEIDWSDDEVETAVCFKRECDAITESCSGFVLYMPFDEYRSEANDLRAQLATANETIAQLRKADTVRPAVSLASAYAEGYSDGHIAASPWGYSSEPGNGNPYEGQ